MSPLVCLTTGDKAMCSKSDVYCSEGITRCSGPEGCRGHGKVRAISGKGYRWMRNIAPNAVDHEPCNGSGLRLCGCETVTDAALAEAMTNAYRAIDAAVESNSGAVAA